MANRKVNQGIIAFFVCLTLACETFSVPVRITPSGIYTTSTYQSTAVIQKSVPTPFSTVQIPLSKQTFGDSKITNSSGTVILEDSLAYKKLNIRVQDNSTNNPLPQIAVQFISDGDNFLLVAFDPSGEYIPLVKSGSFSSVSNLLNSIYGISGTLLMDNLIHLQGGWEEVDLVLNLVSALEKVNSLQDLAGLLTGMPSIEKWSIGYVDTCWNGEQLSNGFSVVTGVVDLILPISGTVFAGPEGLLLASTVAISSHILTDDAKSYLQNLPGFYQLRIYYLPIPFSFRAVEYIGSCNPTSPTHMTETPTLLSLITNNINDLIGIWVGDLDYKTDAGEKDTTPVEMEFSNDCNGDVSPCLLNHDSSDPSNNWLLPYFSQDGPEFCFGFTDSMVRYCFTQQVDGTLWVNGGNGFVIYTGFLHKKITSTDTISPVDMTNPESIATWINKGLQNEDAQVFYDVISETPVFNAFPMPDYYGTPPPCESLMGHYCYISRIEFIQELGDRNQNKIHCMLYIGNLMFKVETWGWDPGWVWPWGEADSVDFVFTRKEIGDKYQMTFVGFGFPRLATIPCP